MNPAALLNGPEIQKFRSSAVLRESLTAELQQPGISAAFEAIIKDLANFPTPDPIPGLHPDSVVARVYFQKGGNWQMLNTLKAMALPTGAHDLEKTPAGLVPFAGSDHMDPRFRDPMPPKFVAPEQA